MTLINSVYIDKILLLPKPTKINSSCTGFLIRSGVGLEQGP